MLTKFLLPPPAAKVGWLLAFPAMILMFAVIQFDFSFGFLHYQQGEQQFFTEDYLWNLKANNFTDEIGTLALLAGLLLIAFSRQPDEDERIRQLRLESLLWVVLVNTLLIMLSVVLFYNGLFLLVMAYNVATTLLLFIVRFHGVLFFERRKAEMS